MQPIELGRPKPDPDAPGEPRPQPRPPPRPDNGIDEPPTFEDDPENGNIEGTVDPNWGTSEIEPGPIPQSVIG